MDHYRNRKQWNPMPTIITFLVVLALAAIGLHQVLLWIIDWAIGG